MRVMVTGATGFTGCHLLEELHWGGAEVVSVSRSVPQDTDGGYRLDLADYPATLECIRSSEPDAIVHLAGIRAGNIDELFRNNVTGTKHLLEAVCEAGIDPNILVISSSAVYGYAGDWPVTEDTPFRPVNDYGVSKVAQEVLALSYHFRHGLKVSVGRPFNLAGPGQDDSFVLGKLVRRWAEAEKSGNEIELLNTDSKRDFIDIRDAVGAYLTIVGHPSFGHKCAGKVFNIGSGRAHSVDDAVQLMRGITGSNIPVSVRKSGFKEPVPFQQADIRAMKSLGWEPEIPLGKTLLDMYIYTGCG